MSDEVRYISFASALRAPKTTQYNAIEDTACPASPKPLTNYQKEVADLKGRNIGTLSTSCSSAGKRLGKILLGVLVFGLGLACILKGGPGFVALGCLIWVLGLVVYAVTKKNKLVVPMKALGPTDARLAARLAKTPPIPESPTAWDHSKPFHKKQKGWS